MVNQILDTEDETLHLPRILCLHGGGTNSRIFRMQCRVLERSLSSSFRLVYPEAPFSTTPGPDVTFVYKKYGPFKAWQRANPPTDNPRRVAKETVEKIESSLSAAMRADDKLGATGEWVALLGFSQGAKMAASILHTQQIFRQRRSWGATSLPEFRFAVLLAGRGPLMWMAPEMPMPRGCVDAARPSTSLDEPSLASGATEHILWTPTVHVHGTRDPGIELHRRMFKRHCRPSTARMMEWDGEHRVPIKTVDVQALVKHVHALAWKAGIVS